MHDGILTLVTSLPLALLGTPGQAKLKKTWACDENFQCQSWKEALRPLSPDCCLASAALRMPAKLTGPPAVAHGAHSLQGLCPKICIYQRKELYYLAFDSFHQCDFQFHCWSEVYPVNLEQHLAESVFTIHQLSETRGSGIIEVRDCAEVTDYCLGCDINNVLSK